MYCEYFCQLELELPVRSFLFPKNLCPYVCYRHFAGIRTFFSLHWLDTPPLVPLLNVWPPMSRANQEQDLHNVSALSFDGPSKDFGKIHNNLLSSLHTLVFISAVG